MIMGYTETGFGRRMSWGLDRALAILLSLLAVLAFPGFLPAAEWWGFDGGTEAAPPEVRLIRADLEGVTLEVTISGMLVEEREFRGEIYHEISLPEAFRTWDVGFPQLPELRPLLGIPGTSGVVARVLEQETLEIPGVLVYPAQHPTTDQSPQEEVINEAFYGGSESYPSETLEAGVPEIWRDVRVSSLKLRPFSYNPDTRTLAASTRLLVDVRFEGYDERNAFTYGAHPVLSRWARQYEGALLNYESLGLTTPRGRNPGTDFLVITVDALRDSVMALANWHHRTGIETDVVNLSQVGSTTDDIHDYILDRYNTDNISAVLLVGDINDLPIRMVSTGIDPSTPSDHWYACLTGSDHRAEVDLARISATEPSMVAHQVRKMITYQTSPPIDGWTTKSLLCAYERSDYIACKNNIAAHSYVYTPPTFEKCYAGQGGTHQQVVDAIENGTQLINYRGHGLYQEWSWSVGWVNNDIYNLENGDYYCLVFNICCENAHLDWPSDCLSEAWMNADHGSAGNLGASRSSWTDPNHTFDEALYQAIYDEGLYGTMEAVNWAKNVIMGSSLGEDNARMYLWLGDPIMQIWTDVPETMEVDHLEVAFIGMSDFTVTATSGGLPLEGARVCLVTDVDDVYEVGLTGPDGTVTLSLAGASTVQNLDITVTAHNHIPYLNTISVLPPSGPYLVCQDRWLDDDLTGDSQGNGNGVLDMGETIEFMVTLQNVGNDPAPAVTAELSCTDEYVTMLDAFEEFGDIPAHGSASCLDDFEFSLATDTPDEHMVDFSLTMATGDSTWETHFSYEVRAPIVTLESFQIDDSAGGDGDGSAEPGETVQVEIRLGNSGTGVATGLVATLGSAWGWAEVTGDSAGAPSIPAGGSVLLTPDFEVAIAGDAPEMALTPMIIELEGDLGLNWSDHFSIPIGGFLDDMEGGVGDWTHMIITPGFVDQWHRTMFYNHTPGGRWCWRFGDAMGGEYSGYADGALLSPMITVGDGSSLTFWHKIEAESSQYYPGSAYDGGLVEMSLDGGPWQIIEPEGGYPFTIRTGSFPGPFPMGTPVFSGDYNWSEAYFDLSSYSGDAQFRFRFGSDGYNGGLGWLIDDLKVLGGQLPPTDVPLEPAVSLPAQLALEQNRPNPFNPVTVIEYALPQEGLVELSVYDVNGRLVRSLITGVETAGTHRIMWDGRDDARHPVASGIYYYRLTAGDQALARSMVLLK